MYIRKEITAMKNFKKIEQNTELVNKSTRPYYFDTDTVNLDDSEPYDNQDIIQYNGEDIEIAGELGNFLLDIESNIDMLNKQYTIGEIRALWKQRLDDLYAKRDFNIIRKSNINKVIKYVYSWRVSTHFDEDNREYYIVDNRPSMIEHKFYRCGRCPYVLAKYSDIFLNEDWLVGEMIKSFVRDIYSGLWHVDLRDREVRTLCAYLKPLFGTDVVDLIMDRRKNKKSEFIEIYNSPEDVELINSLNKQEPDEPLDDIVAMSDQLFGGDE